MLLGLLAVTPVGVARALTPTADSRSIDAGSEGRSAVPFQPFDDAVVYFQLGLPAAAAYQTSSILSDAIVGSGSASAAFVNPTSPVTASSSMTVGFDLGEWSLFSLEAALSANPAGAVGLRLDRIAPDPGEVIARFTPGTLDQLVALPAGSYELAVVAFAAPVTNVSFDLDFHEACSSPDPQDSDGDGVVDACEAASVPLLPSAAYGLLALALLLGAVPARRRSA